MSKDLLHGWDAYIVQCPHAIETVSWYLFDTKRFDNNDNHRMIFFSDVNFHKPVEADNNLYVPGCLPNPQAYLIQGMRVFGLPSRLADTGRIRLVIGNKEYQDTSVKAFIYNQWKTREIPVMIPPMVNFWVSISWKLPMYYGRPPLITVMFKGILARPVQ